MNRMLGFKGKQIAWRQQKTVTIEKVEIGKRRAEQLAKTFDVHPAIIMFPEYEAKEIEKAA